MSAVLSTVVGALLVALALVDVFQTLLRPGGTGRLTEQVFRLSWRLVTRGARPAMVSGPLTILAVIVIWVTLVTVGWALIYLPHLPQGFAYSGVDPADYHPLVEAMTISLVTLTTLGYGDAVPAEPILRAVSPLEALMGFALLTAAVSWFMQLYPALARRRSFAMTLTSMHEASVIASISRLPAERATDVLDATARSLAEISADLAQNPEIFYFRDRDPRMSMPRATGYALDLRDRTLAASDETVRLQAQVLAREIDALGSLMRRQYPHVRGASSDDILGHVADSHGHTFGDT